MHDTMRLPLLVSLVLVSLSLSAPAQAQQAAMTFFITSVGPGHGANLGGLEGADRHCQALAEAAGAGNRTWRAYLSTQAVGGAPAVNARDRIGRGPWQNAKGVVIAKDVDALHGENHISKQTALSEKGEMINGRGDTPNRHDILTGSTPDGRAFPPGEDRTCGNWTKSTQGRRWSATTIAWGSARSHRRSRGTRRIRHAGQTVAAARPICAVPAAMGCSTASSRTSAVPHGVEPTRPSGTGWPWSASMSPPSGGSRDEGHAGEGSRPRTGVRGTPGVWGAGQPLGTGGLSHHRALVSRQGLTHAACRNAGGQDS